MDRLKKMPIRVIEIDRKISKQEGSIGEIYRHFTIHRFDIAVKFEKDKVSEFQSVKVTLFNIGPPLYLKTALLEIYPNGEDLVKRAHGSPEDFVDFVVDTPREDFLNILSKKYEVEIKLLSEEKRLPV